MGFNLNKAMAAREEILKSFTPLELNEGNVRAIFNRCGKDGENGSTAWDEEALKKNRENIRYLLGQLALVHKGVKEHELDSAFFKKYDDKSWAVNSNLLIDFLNMGGKSGFCSFFKKDGKQFVELKLNKLKSTLSPKDGAFAAWYEKNGAEFEAEYAYAAGKAAYEKGDYEKAIPLFEKAVENGHESAKSCLEKCQTVVKAMQGDAEAQYAYAEQLEWSDMAEAFAFYLKAARQGHRDAQYKTGYCYALGKGTEKNSQEALKWLQASAKQGHEKAGILSGLMCKKGLLGDKAADLEVELSKLIDRYETISDCEKNLLIGLYKDFSDDMKDKFNHAQAKSLRK